MSGPVEQYTFPPLEAATPEGLLAVGGDLSSGRLLSAYRQGIFPWYSTDQPIPVSYTHLTLPPIYSV